MIGFSVIQSCFESNFCIRTHIYTHDKDRNGHSATIVIRLQNPRPGIRYSSLPRSHQLTASFRKSADVTWCSGQERVANEHSQVVGQLHLSSDHINTVPRHENTRSYRQDAGSQHNYNSRKTTTIQTGMGLLISLGTCGYRSHGMCPFVTQRTP